VQAEVSAADAQRLMADLQEKFDRYYSIQLSNYMVQDAYVANPVVIRPPALRAPQAAKEVA
jgi:formylmethanofuran dehydrogenase subunit A